MLLHTLQQLRRASGSFQPSCQLAWAHTGLTLLLSWSPAHSSSTTPSTAVQVLVSRLSASNAAARGWLAALALLTFAAGVVVLRAALLGPFGPYESSADVYINITGCSITAVLGLAGDCPHCPTVGLYMVAAVDGRRGKHNLVAQQPRPPANNLRPMIAATCVPGCLEVVICAIGSRCRWSWIDLQRWRLVGRRGEQLVYARAMDEVRSKSKLQ